MLEKGEQLRICPEKERAEVARYQARVGLPIDGDAAINPMMVQRMVDFKPKSRQELACPADCPGKTIRPRTLLGGRVTLPSIFDIEECPLKEN